MKYQIGNILENVKSGVIVHGCNAQGIMGGGIALQIKEMYPFAYKGYLNMLNKHREVQCNGLGSVSLVKVAPDLYIANAITQDYFGTDERHVNYESVARAFEIIGGDEKTKDIPIHYPMIGAGLGGGNWNIIKTIINETLIGCDHTLWTLK